MTPAAKAARISKLEADIATLEDAQMNQLTGKQVIELSSDGGTVKYQPGQLTGAAIIGLIQQKKTELRYLKAGRGGGIAGVTL